MGCFAPTLVTSMEKTTTGAKPERAGITALQQRTETMRTMLVEMIIPVGSMVKVTTGATGIRVGVNVGQWSQRESHI